MTNSSMKHDFLNKLLNDASDRYELWSRFIHQSENIVNVAELGVFKGDFAQRILTQCPKISSYLMIDPWRHLDNWNKPANKNDAMFEQFMNQTLKKTEFAKEKRRLIRGTTLEAAPQIEENSLDFIYIDGDHTLRGITIDLISMYSKVKDNGFIAGDDYSSSIWQHKTKFEPTLVFPYAVFFAEAVGAKIYSLPFAQFLIQKTANRNFEHIDLTGNYSDTSLQSQLTLPNLMKIKMKDVTRSLKK